MSLFNLGIAILCVFVLLDLMVRVRMRRIGHKWIFLRGALFDYGEYLKVRSKYGWAAWPVYLLWATFAVGVALAVVGVFR
jgi:hypothetical protein